MTRREGKNAYIVLKRILDVICAGMTLLVASPVLGAIAVAVAVKHGKPVIFSQDRPGKDGEIFRLYKFRSMRPVDAGRNWVTDAERLTEFGIWLRATSLDELPSFYNVLRGDMSLVGPRPLLVQYLGRYSTHQARRHQVRPGITGLAQISGRNNLEWNAKFDLDVQYVDGISFGTDLSILWRTLAAVVRRDGISASTHVTMPEFRGKQTPEESIDE
ncbi:sugar transferase [Arthrobacter sp. KK5.5]|uniref:sugar transferase n=1 Tax=Arthrobacter sp. KK5.5 TaxID=3373084 RepID=UPI003EE63BA0